MYYLYHVSKKCPNCSIASSLTYSHGILYVSDSTKESKVIVTCQEKSSNIPVQGWRKATRVISCGSGAEEQSVNEMKWSPSGVPGRQKEGSALLTSLSRWCWRTAMLDGVCGVLQLDGFVTCISPSPTPSFPVWLRYGYYDNRQRRAQYY